MNEHNPYTPPSAAVQDVQVLERRVRPVAVVTAVIVLTVYLLWAGIANVRLFALINTGFVAPAFFLWSLGQMAVVVVTCIYLWRGRSWARVLLLVLTAYSLLTLFRQIWSWEHRPAGVDLPLGVSLLFSMLVTPMINLVALYLVYLPGRAWFARRP